jgi:hypothetical protein
MILPRWFSDAHGRGFPGPPCLRRVAFLVARVLVGQSTCGSAPKKLGERQKVCTQQFRLPCKPWMRSFML